MRFNKWYRLISLMLIFISAVVLWKVNFRNHPSQEPAMLMDFETEQAGMDKQWVSQILENIKKEEYHISQNTDEGLQAPNRKQNLRTSFKSHGIKVEPRVKNSHSTWNWRWQTKAFGRPGNVQEIAAVEPKAQSNRVEYARQELTEWYDNKPEGLEQGFIIHRRPAPAKKSSIVKIISQPIAGLTPQLSSNKESITFLDSNQVKVLEYGKLLVKDSSGTTLHSEMRLVKNQIILVYVDQDAVYPVHIDPLLTSPSWTAESDQATALFGFSVAGAGDVNGDGYNDIIVGAIYYDNGETNEGRAFVYHGSASGLNSSPSWTAESNQAEAYFGQSVASAGDVNGDGYSDVIVGAINYDSGETNEGRAYVFLGSAGGLNASPAWTAESNSATAYFGGSVSCAGDVNGDGYSDVIVGAGGYENGETDEGRAYVYHGSGSGLSASPVWTAEGNQSFSYFGSSVASAGDVNGDGYSDVVVGVPGYDSISNEGRAYVFLGSAGGLNASPAWTKDGDQINATLGRAVSSAGDVNGDGYSDVIVSADQYDNPEMDEGRVYIYHGSSGGLNSSPARTLECNQGGAFFGYSVASAGDVNGDGYSDVIVGAIYFDNGENNEGRAYVYLGSAGGLNASPTWTSEGNQASASFGCAVAGAGDVNGDGFSDVIVGAKWYDNGQTDEGRAFVYHGSADGLSINQAWSAESDWAGGQLGYSLASAGDVNADGYGDVILGIPYYDTGVADIGRIFIFHGKDSGLSTSAEQILDGSTENELFGFSVALAGDVNGDGYCDIIVGAPHYSNGETNEGRVYAYLGNVSGVSASPAWTVESNQTNAQLGYCVASAGDVNGDGYSDVIISAPYYNNQGRVWVHAGSAGGLGISPLWFAESGQTQAQFGYSVASAGDVNGDGFGDVAIGTPFYDNGQSDEGSVFVYYGQYGGIAALPSWTAESNQANAQYGHAVASAGDVNGDGFADLIIGANLYDDTQSNEGRAYVYHGSSTGLNTFPAWTKVGGQNSAQFGCAVASCGDVNNDGYGDVAIGAFQYGNGRAYVFHGASGGLSGSAEWIGQGDQAGSQYGFCVAGSGDVNGDGYADLLVGAPLYDNGETDEGRAYLYYGNSGTAMKSLPRQVRPDNLQLIGPAGLASNSSGNTEFIARLFGRSSQGRTRARLQVQSAPLGQALETGLLSTQVGYTDTGISGVDLSYSVNGLNPLQAYHWRARVMYDPSRAANGQLYSTWYSPSWSSLSGGADFRTGPAPVPTATPTITVTPTISPTPLPYTPTPTSTPTIVVPQGFKGRLIEDRYFYVYPNPTRSTQVLFRFYLKQSAKVRIAIYTTSSQFVWSHENHYPQGWSEWVWNASGMANGVYLYKADAEADGVHEHLIKKVALVR